MTTMRRTLIVYCEACGSDRPSGDDFVVFPLPRLLLAGLPRRYQAADDRVGASKKPDRRAARRPETRGPAGLWTSRPG
jgi:hypothetical protein